MLCAMLNSQLRHSALSRPLIYVTRYHSFKCRQTPSEAFNHILYRDQFIQSSSCCSKLNFIYSKSYQKYFYSQCRYSLPNNISILQGKNVSIAGKHNSQSIGLSEGSHILSRNKIQDFYRTSFNFTHNVLHTKPAGSTEYTKGAFNIPKLILDASPTSAQPYLQMIRFDRPIGTWLLYWPCTWSIALAAQPGCWPDFYMLALFGAGAFFMRGAGCIINDMWDKDFDYKVERTRGRPLASGKVTYPQAMVFLGSQLAISLAILMQLNWYSICLGVASMGIVITYPAFKRFTYWPQIVLGFAFNYGALLGWSAIQGSCDWSICLPLYFMCHMWTMIYDTVYAHQGQYETVLRRFVLGLISEDKSDDLLIGVKSTALRFGDQTKPWLTSFTTLMAGGLLYVGHSLDMTWPYYTGATITIASIFAQLYRLDIDNPQACGDAFRFHFYIGLLMFVSIMFGNLGRPRNNEDKTKMDESLLPA